jgi:hypothetical protein
MNWDILLIQSDYATKCITNTKEKFSFHFALAPSFDQNKVIISMSRISEIIIFSRDHSKMNYTLAIYY